MYINIEFINVIDLKIIPIYYKCEYNEIFSKYDDSDFKILKIVFEKEQQYVYLPLLINKIDENVFEGYSTYGYSGFYTEGEYKIIKSLMIKYWDEINQFMKDNNIISLFLRNSPYLKNQNLLKQEYNSLNRITYLAELKKYKGIDEFLTTRNSSTKRSIRYSIKSNAQIYFVNYKDITDEEFEDFYKIYLNSMKEKNTWGYYFFNKQFFKEHIVKLKEHCEIAFVVDKHTNKRIAIGMFLLDEYENLVHYHFGAFDIEYQHYRPMYFLFANAICRYGNMGKEYLHLGGGLSIDESDGLSRFKKSFADEKKEYYLSKIVFDQERYIEVRKKYDLEDSNIFLIKDALSIKSK